MGHLDAHGDFRSGIIRGIPGFPSGLYIGVVNLLTKSPLTGLYISDCMASFWKQMGGGSGLSRV